MAKKEKSKYRLSADKPVGTGNTRLKFDNKPSIGPTDDAKKKNPALEESMFNQDALGSEIPATGEYAAKSKKGYFMEKCFDHIMPNTISPTENY